MLDPRALLIAFALGLAAGAGLAGKLVADYKDARHATAIAAQQVEAAAQLQAATERAIATERANIRLADRLETEHAASRTKLDHALADNRRLARELGGMRDPGSRPDCSGPVSAAAGAAEQSAPGAAGARLSAEAEEFLLAFARRADEVAAYAATCHAWVTDLKRRKTP